MNGRARKRVVWAGSLLILLCAIAPNALYAEHWPGLPWSQTIDTPHEVAEHSAHCHGGQQSCSQEGAFGPALPVDTSAALLLLFGGALLLAEMTMVFPSESLASRLRRPPRLIPS